MHKGNVKIRFDQTLNENHHGAAFIILANDFEHAQLISDFLKIKFPKIEGLSIDIEQEPLRLFLK